ncbi:hypothetical protein ACLOJK_002734 [Asimina triloba]
MSSLRALVVGIQARNGLSLKLGDFLKPLGIGSKQDYCLGYPSFSSSSSSGSSSGGSGSSSDDSSAFYTLWRALRWLGSGAKDLFFKNPAIIPARAFSDSGCPLFDISVCNRCFFRRSEEMAEFFSCRSLYVPFALVLLSLISPALSGSPALFITAVEAGAVAEIWSFDLDLIVVVTDWIIAGAGDNYLFGRNKLIES